MSKVAITGLGLLSPLGRGPETSWDALAGGSSSLTRDPGDDGPEWMRWAGRVGEVELPSGLPREILSQTRFLNRGARLGFAAAHDALLQAGSAEHVSPERRALFLATGDLTAADCLAFHPATTATGRDGGVDVELINREAVARVNPFFLLDGLANNPFSMLAAAFGFQGPGTTLASQSPAGGQALDLAVRSLSRRPGGDCSGGGLRQLVEHGAAARDGRSRSALALSGRRKILPAVRSPARRFHRR